MAEQDEFGEFVSIGGNDEFGEFVSLNEGQKKSPSSTTGTNSTTPSQQPTTPSQTNGSGWTNASTQDSGLTPPVQQKRYDPRDWDIYRSEETKKLKEKATQKTDVIRADAKQLKQDVNAVEFATQYPEYKQLQQIDEQIKALGEPKSKEQITAYNDLVGKRNALLETDVSGRDVFKESAPNLELKQPTDFETAGDYAAYQQGLQKQFQDFAKQKEKFETAKPRYEGATKLKDVIGIADKSQANAASLTEKIKADQKEADESINAARELNKDKLEKLGFGAGFMEGMEQTTLANTVADIYLTGNDDQLMKSLENIYEDALVFPKETTGLGGVGELLGGQVKPIAVGAAAGALSPAAGFTAGTLYYGRLGAGGSLIDAYTTARSQGMTAPEALDIAKKQAKVGGVAGAAEGALGMLTLGGKPLASLATMPFKKAVTTALADNGVDAVVAGMSQYVQNKNLQRLGIDVDDTRGVADEMGAELLFGAGMNLAAYGGSKIPGYGTIINGIAKLPFQDIQAQVDNAVKAGVLDEAKAQAFTTDVIKSKAAQDKLKGVTIPEDVEDAVIDKQKQIDALEIDKETASPAVLPAIEGQIEAKSKEIAEELGTPLNEKEQKEYEKLVAKRDATDSEGKKTPLLESEKKAIEHYEKRLKTAETFGRNEANKIATDLGFNNATHLLNKIKKKGLGEFEKVQDVPTDIIEQLKNKEDATQEISEQESVSTERESGSESGQTNQASGSDSIQREAAGAEEGEVADGGVTAPTPETTTPQAGVVGGEVENRKNKQLEIINKENPAPNNYNTWVRSVEDIKTADEVFEVAKNEGAIYPDFTEQNMEDALSKGEVVVYSSYPIKNGVFVSPSKMNAQDYAGGKGGKIYSKVVKLEDVAWIDEGQGQYAKVEQSLQATKQVEQAAEKVGIKPKDFRELYNINRKLFGQDRVKSFASAMVMDRAIGVMAKRAGITKAEMYDRLEFRKATEKDLPQGVKLQFDAWHGSPYQFDKFTTEKIGTGEGAQAFGWGLYFTDLESIAKSYAKELAYAKRGYLIDGEIVKDQDLEPLQTEALNDIIRMGYDGALDVAKRFYDTYRTERNKKVVEHIKEFKGKKIQKIEDRNLYKVSLHKGKTPDQYTWLEWDKPVSNEVLEKINKQLNDFDGWDDGRFFTNDDAVAESDRQAVYVEDGKQLYEYISKQYWRWDGDRADFSSNRRMDKDASLFLLDLGIDGIKYPAESISRGATSETARGFNYVVFDENAVSIEEVIKFQKDAEKARGAAMVNMDGTAVIYALSDPNVSTPLHEIAHVFEHYMDTNEKNHVIQMAGTKGWTTETSEYFARGFEKYLADGIAPTKALQKIFDRLKEWLTDIYKGIKGSGIDVKLNEPMREVYAKMLGEEATKAEPKTTEVQRRPTTMPDGKEGKVAEEKLPTLKELKEQNKRFKLETLSAEPTTPREWLMKFFAGGGKINTEDLKRETGFGSRDDNGKMRSVKDFGKRIWMHSKKAVGIDRLIEALQEDWRTNFGEELDYQDARNEIIDVIKSYEKPTQILDELRQSFSVGDIIIKDKYERIAAKEMAEMERRYEAEQELLDGVKAEEAEALAEILNEIEERNLSSDEIRTEADAYDAYLESLTPEQRAKEIEYATKEYDQATDSIAESKTNVEDKGSGKIQQRADEEVTSERAAQKERLTVATEKWQKAESQYQKSKQALSQVQSEKQTSMFDGTEQRLFDDTKQLTKQTESLRLLAEEAKAEVDKLQDIVDSNIEGQQDLFEPQTNIGKSVTFDFAGAERVGVVQSIDEQGNYKVKGKDGTNYTVSPENARSTELIEAAKKSFEDNLKKIDSIIKTPAKNNVAPPPKEAAIVPKEVVTAPMKALGMVDKVAEKFAERLDDAVAKTYRKGIESSNKFISFAAGQLQGLFKQLGLTQADMEARRKGLGKMNVAPLKAVKFYQNAVDAVGRSPESLRNVHQVLDPEVYEKRGETPIAYDQLTPEEKNLYDLLRATNDMIHDWHFANGRISEETYLKNKGTYAPRFYDNIEFEGLPTELKEAFEDYSKTQNFSYVKERQNFEDVMGENTVTEDPAYGTAMRLAQMLRNQAMLDYAAEVNSKVKTYNEGDENIPRGYVKLEGGGQFGNIKIYGDLTNKYVPRDYAEDFKGATFINSMADSFYQAFRRYDRTAIRQILKKSKTLYNPITQLGNIGSNYVFAMMNGIDPLTFQKNKVEAAQEVKNKGDLFVKLVEEGLLGTDITTRDLKEEAGPKGEPKKGIRALASAIDDKVSDFYGSRDDIAKIAAYLSHTKDYGRTEAEAIKRVSEGFQNYNNVGRFYDFASKTPVIGNPFVKFKGDLLRIMKNNFAKRPLTNIALLGMFKLIADGFSELSDEDENVKAARERRPFIPKIPLPDAVGGDIPLVWKTPIGEVNAARYFSPLNIYDMGDKTSVVEEITQFLPYQLNDFEGASTKIPDFADPFLGVYTQLAFDKDFRGKPIVDPEKTKFREGNATADEKALNAAIFIARQQIPFFSNADDMRRAIEEKPDYYGRNRNLKQALLSNALKVQDFDAPEAVESLKKEIEMRMRDMDKLNDQMRDAKSVAGKNIKKINEGSASPESKQKQVKDEYIRAQNKIAELLEKQAQIKQKLVEPAELLKKIKR